MKETATRAIWHKAGAEAMGTFALVFAGCGAIMVDELTNGALTHSGVASVFGLVIMAMIYATGHISGAHLNPAVTLAFASTGRIAWGNVFPYIAAQVAAALGAAIALRAILGPAADIGATFPRGSSAQSLAMEFLLTFFLMFVIRGVATDSRANSQLAGIAIGGTVALGAMFGGPISGASMNPARSIGPALVIGRVDSLSIYIIGPLLGALAGARAYELVCCDDPNPKSAGGCC